MINKITNLINEKFNKKLSKEGKKIINEWLLDEFETIYYAQKQLDSDDSILDFINDMLAEKKLKIDELCVHAISRVATKNHIKKEGKKKPFKYCPYCGEHIGQ